MTNMTLTLNDDQQKALLEIIKFIDDPTEQYYVLTGVAGTGKTTLIKALLDERDIVLTATTNKAASVLSDISGGNASTIHSLLSLRPYRGKLQITKDCGAFEDPILIDEASMVDKQLFEILMQFGKKTGTKMIFCGDVTQLPPVMEDISQVFASGFPTSELTKIMRQADGPLQEACIAFQKFVLNDTQPNIEVDDKEIICLNGRDFMKAFEEDCLAEGWQNQDSKYLAWTNKAVLKVNNDIVTKKRGSPRIQKGDLLTCNNYVVHQGESIKTDTLVYISEVQHDFSMYVMKGLNIDGCMAKIDNNFWFCPYNIKDIDKAFKALSDIGDFDGAYTIKNQWIDLRSVYGITVHKAQGNTFKRVYLDLANIRSAMRVDFNLYKKLVYVGISRASEQLIIKD